MSATVVDVRCRGTVVALALLTSMAGCSDMAGTFGTGGSGGVAGSGGGTTGTGGTAGAGGQPGGMTNPLTQDVIDAFVAAHNQARSGPLNPPPSPPLPPVSWDAILADSVYNYAIGCQGVERPAQPQREPVDRLPGAGRQRLRRREHLRLERQRRDARRRHDAVDERGLELRLRQRQHRQRRPLHADRLAR